MSDIIIPPQGVPAAANSDIKQQQQQVLQQIQQQILSLPNNTTIFSTVAGVDRNSNPVIRFAGFDLVLSVPFLLSKGAQLALRVDNSSGSGHLQLISVDGKLPPTQPQQASGQFPDLAKQAANNIRILQAFPQNTVALKGEDIETENITRAETVVFSSQQNAITKGVVVLPNPEMMRAIKQNQAALSDNGQIPEAIKNLPDELKTGTEITFKILNIALSPAEQEELPPQKLEQKIIAEVQNTRIEITPEGKVKLTAIVLGTNNNDELLVQTRVGQIVIDNPLKGQDTSLPHGAEITLEIEDLHLPQPILLPQDEKKTTLKLLSEGMSSLNSLTQNEQGKEILNKVAGLHDIPAARIIKFINAVRNNKLEDWLSDEVLKEMDGKTREQLVQQLRADFQNLQKVMNEQGQSWQTVFFPIFDGEDLHHLQLHVKNFREDEEKTSKYNGTRFIVELAAGTFGEMQLDGLVRKNIGGSNFDLIIRTHQNLDTEVRSDVTQIFNNAAEITGFKGGIDFSVMREFPNRILEEKLSGGQHKRIDA